MGVVVVDLTAKDGVSPTLNKVDGNAKKLNKTLTDSRGRLRNAQGQFVAMSKSAGTARQSVKLLGTTFSTYLGPVVAIGAAITGVSKALSIMGDREADAAALANGLKGLTTNGAAALDELKGKADELGKATLFNEEDFTKAFKMLTSFRTIGVSSYGDVATTAADMAQVLGQDVNSVMLQVAKALEAPDVGLTALQRSGTRFTDQQKQQVKAMVKANDIAGAQAFILKELNKQYGGAAKSAAKGFAGAMDTLGEVTRDAFEAFGTFIAPTVISGIKLLSTGIEKLSIFFSVLGKRVIPLVQSALEPVMKTIQDIFKDIPFDKVANIIGNQIVNNFVALGKVLKFVSPLIVRIIDALVFTLKNSPLGLIVQQAYKLAVAMGLAKPLVEETAEATNKLGQGFNDIPGKIDAAAEAKKRLIEKTKESLDFLTKEKTEIEAQKSAYQNTINVTNARLNAEKAINDLQGQILDRAYEQASTATQRLNIAKQIFVNEVNGAKLVYQQTLNSIKAEQDKLLLKRQGAVIDGQILKARGDMLVAETKGVEAKKKARAQADKALEAQSEAIRLIDGQIKAQIQVGEHQKTAAKAQLEAKIITAEQNVKQKLVSKEIGMSNTKANDLVTSLGNSVRNTDDLSSKTGQVATNADQSAHNFIRVATQASNAAFQIGRAVTAQRNLNAARAARSSSNSGTTETAAAGAYWSGGFQAFAKGGMVKGPTLGLIGEGGEPEYIIPQSKAAGFAANFLSGKRGTGAIPGFADGGVVAPSSASVNIQTGPVTQMGGQNYVTMQDMSQAVQAGVQQTLQFLMSDRTVRTGVGFD
tara:strand:- start:5924 stop:8368 length:2445 start_codon:yes stop_codon:yes gene_type:complete